MEEYFSPSISAYGTNHSYQHVIIWVLEEWRKETGLSEYHKLISTFFKSFLQD